MQEVVVAMGNAIGGILVGVNDQREVVGRPCRGAPGRRQRLACGPDLIDLVTSRALHRFER